MFCIPLRHNIPLTSTTFVILQHDFSFYDCSRRDMFRDKMTVVWRCTSNSGISWCIYIQVLRRTGVGNLSQATGSSLGHLAGQTSSNPKNITSNRS